MATCPTDQLHDIVIRLQSIMTLNIISGMPRIDLIKASVKVIDIIWWVNKTYKMTESQIGAKEFYNDTINENI